MHSALLVGFESAKTIGRGWLRAIVPTKCGEDWMSVRLGAMLLLPFAVTICTGQQLTQNLLSERASHRRRADDRVRLDVSDELQQVFGLLSFLCERLVTRVDIAPPRRDQAVNVHEVDVGARLLVRRTLAEYYAPCNNCMQHIV